MKQFTLNKTIPEIYAANGISLVETLRRAGLPDDLFSRNEAKVDAEEYYRFVEATTINVKTGAALIRLATENDLDKVTPQVIGALCSRNIIEAIGRMALYADMFLPIILKTENTEAGFCIELQPFESIYSLPPVFAAMELMFLLKMFRDSTGLPLVPLEVNLGIESDKAIEEYFGVKPEYNHRNDPYMIFSKEDSEAPFISANDDLWTQIEPDLNMRLAELKEGCSFADRVRGALLELLPSGRCKIEDVAARLQLSVRTIQRRLTEEGVRFQTVLQKTRETLDKGLDNIPNLKKTDRAFLLGFNHIDSYRRAMASK